MTKKLLEFFEGKFDANLKKVGPDRAFEDTIHEIGFQAYADEDSFKRAKRRKQRGK